MRMKALKDFRGRPGEGTSAAHGDRFVEAGGEFTPQGAGRGDWLERRGMAVPVSAEPAIAPEPREARVQNEAAAAGPLPSAGGGTGAPSAASSSPADPAPGAPTSPRRKAAGARSRSTKATG